MFGTPHIVQHQFKKRYSCPTFSVPYVLSFDSSSICSLIHLQYTTHQPVQAWSYPSAGPIQSAPSALYAHYFHQPAYSPRRHAHSHPDAHLRPRPSPHSHTMYYAPNQGHAHAHVHHAHAQPALVPVHHSSQSRSRRRSTGEGPLIAGWHLPRQPASGYPSHPHSDPRYTQTKGILKNRGGRPAPAVSHCRRMASSGGPTCTQGRTNHISHASNFHLATVGGIRLHRSQSNGFESDQRRPYSLFEARLANPRFMTS